MVRYHVWRHCRAIVRNLHAIWIYNITPYNTTNNKEIASCDQHLSTIIIHRLARVVPRLKNTHKKTVKSSCENKRELKNIQLPLVIFIVQYNYIFININFFSIYIIIRSHPKLRYKIWKIWDVSTSYYPIKLLIFALMINTYNSFYFNSFLLS